MIVSGQTPEPVIAIYLSPFVNILSFLYSFYSLHYSVLSFQGRLLLSEADPPEEIDVLLVCSHFSLITLHVIFAFVGSSSLFPFRFCILLLFATFCYVRNSSLSFPLCGMELLCEVATLVLSQVSIWGSVSCLVSLRYTWNMLFPRENVRVSCMHWVRVPFLCCLCHCAQPLRSNAQIGSVIAG